MNSQRNLAIIHFTNEEYEQTLKMQGRISQALSRGRNVVLICDAPMVRRMERMTFACLGLRDAPGRFAIVTEDVDQFSEAIPSVLADRMQIFESQNEAFDWLDPNPVDENDTLLLLDN